MKTVIIIIILSISGPVLGANGPTNQERHLIREMTHWNIWDSMMGDFFDDDPVALVAVRILAASSFGAEFVRWACGK